MDTLTVVSLVCEVISLVTIPAGLIGVIAAAISHARSGRWVETDAVVVSSENGLAAAWFDDDGGLHQARLRRHSADHGDGVQLWVGRADASRHRFTEPGAHARVLRTVGLALLVPGVIAAAVGSAATLAS